MQNELDVPEQIVRDLLSVAGADIVVVADDSGSMGAVANYVTRSTRWTARWGRPSCDATCNHRLIPRRLRDTLARTCC